MNALPVARPTPSMLIAIATEYPTVSATARSWTTVSMLFEMFIAQQISFVIFFESGQSLVRLGFRRMERPNLETQRRFSS